MILLLTIVGSSYAAPQQKSLVILSAKCYEYTKSTNLDTILHTALSSITDTEFKVRKFYLDCHTSCHDFELQCRFDIVWKKILKENPDYLIVYNNNLWQRFKSQFMDFAKDKTKKVGIFNIFINKDIVNDIEFMTKLNITNILFSAYHIDIRPVIYYFSRNAAEYNNFIILRNADAENLQIATTIRRQIKEVNPANTISVIEVFSEQDLKSLLIELQGLPKQSVIIPVMDNLSNNTRGFININSILYDIKRINKAHIELSLTDDASDYIGVSYAYALSPELSTIDTNNNIEYFLNKFTGDEVTMLHEDSYLIVNKTELQRVIRGRNLLRITYDHVDGFKE